MARQRTQHAAGPGLPQTADQRIRWLPFKNYSDETIPPFACMEVTISSSVDDVIGGEHIWRAFKPTLASATASNPGTLMFNDGAAIPVDGYGRGTFDMPARAIVRADLSFQSHGAQGLGPQNGSWLLGVGEAFNYIDSDRTEPLGEGTSSSVASDRFKAIWINRISQAAPHYAMFADASAHPLDVAANAFLPEMTDSAIFSDGRVGGSPGLLLSGMYFVSVCMTVAFNDAGAPNNAPLLMGLYLDDKYVGLSGLRYPFKPGGVYETGATIENVAFSGLVNVHDDDQFLRIKNLSAYTVKVYTETVSFHRIAAEIANHNYS